MHIRRLHPPANAHLHCHRWLASWSAVCLHRRKPQTAKKMTETNRGGPSDRDRSGPSPACWYSWYFCRLPLVSHIHACASTKQRIGIRGPILHSVPWPIAHGAAARQLGKDSRSGTQRPEIKLNSGHRVQTRESNRLSWSIAFPWSLPT